jgi:hypothetical protein
MEAVHYVNTSYKAKFFLVGGQWDMDNAGFVAPYVLNNLENLKYNVSKKRASLRRENLL